MAVIQDLPSRVRDACDTGYVLLALTWAAAWWIYVAVEHFAAALQSRIAQRSTARPHATAPVPPTPDPPDSPSERAALGGPGRRYPHYPY